MPSPVRKPSCPPTDRKSVGGCGKNTPGKDAKNATDVPRTGHLVPPNECAGKGGKKY